MIDRLVHHAEILSLKGDSYRLRGKDLGSRSAPPADLPEQARGRLVPALAYGSLRNQPAHQPSSGLVFNRRKVA